ncbi:MAG: hypothetical protein KOO60_11505 [Gemmatimonadales bacterium]|nr:hypothetical protein [Gemmatimonadales bacterium]
MNRINGVLVLMVAGMFISGVLFIPGEARSGDFISQAIELSDIKDDVPEDIQAKAGDGVEGDPDAGGDGLGYSDKDDVWELDGLFEGPKKQVVNELWMFLVSSIWLVP